MDKSITLNMHQISSGNVIRPCIHVMNGPFTGCSLHNWLAGFNFSGANWICKSCDGWSSHLARPREEDKLDWRGSVYYIHNLSKEMMTCEEYQLYRVLNA